MDDRQEDGRSLADVEASDMETGGTQVDTSRKDSSLPSVETPMVVGNVAESPTRDTLTQLSQQCVGRIQGRTAEKMKYG